MLSHSAAPPTPNPSKSAFLSPACHKVPPPPRGGATFVKQKIVHEICPSSLRESFGRLPPLSNAFLAQGPEKGCVQEKAASVSPSPSSDPKLTALGGGTTWRRRRTGHSLTLGTGQLHGGTGKPPWWADSAGPGEQWRAAAEGCGWGGGHRPGQGYSAAPQRPTLRVQWQ